MELLRAGKFASAGVLASLALDFLGTREARILRRRFEGWVCVWIVSLHCNSAPWPGCHNKDLAALQLATVLQPCARLSGGVEGRRYQMR